MPLAPGQTLRVIEDKIVTQFQRAADAYLPRLPDPGHWLEWLAIIQHHGGPTRLLDFTKSIYVAAFFAFDEAEEGVNPGIWAVNGHILREWLKKFIQVDELEKIPWTNATEASQVFDFLYHIHKFKGATTSGYAAGIVTPINLNQRLAVQQGTFLTSFNPNHTLEENVYGMFDLDPAEIHKPPQGFFTNVRSSETLQRLQKSPLIRVVLDRKLRSEALTELGRMNIKSGSLFPGIDGYTRDLRRQAYWHTAEAAQEANASQQPAGEQAENDPGRENQ